MLAQPRLRITLAPWVAMAAAALAGGACSGRIGDSPGDSPGEPGTGGSIKPPNPGAGTPPPRPAAFKPAPAGLRRLTRAQYTNSIRDLLGADVAVPPDLEPDTVLSGFASIGAAITPYPATATEKFEQAGLALATQLLGDPARRARVVTCAPAAGAARDDGCARTFLTSFGRRAWRRPLVDDELTRYLALARTAGEAAGDFWRGLAHALAALLQSPNFLYRVELGTPGPVKGERVFDDWELATRLSYFLWNSTPDEGLLAAAQAGALSRPGGLRKEAERLLASPRARLATQEFFQELLRLDGLDDLEQSPTAFPQVTKTLGPAMREETLRFVEDVLGAPGADYRRVFDGATTFVNRELARLYGLPAPAGDGFERVATPAGGPRVGLLGQGSFLALNAHEKTTSPTRRGKFIREVLLCQSIPVPPPDVDASLPPDTAEGTTMREKLAAHSLVASCAACHNAMDPIGLAFENFDAIGRFRAMDAGKAIDASGDLDGARFSGPRQVATLLREHPAVDECLVRGIYRYALGHVETDGEEPLITRIAGSPGAQQRFRTLILGVVESDGFRVAAESP